jgi:hypothetical protein
MNTHRKTHWETIYGTKTPEQVSWTQEVPQTSLKFIHALGVQKDAQIIENELYDCQNRKIQRNLSVQSIR